VTTIRIGTRKSKLALWQAEHVAAMLRALHPQCRVELVRMTTQGDRILDTPLAKVGGKGLFVKELEEGLLARRVDIAVHSMKDVTVDLPAGLHIAVVLEREEPFDALVSNRYRRLDDLPHGAVVGTSSLRRQCQLRRRRPDLRIETLRGNVNTRLARLDEGRFDAIVLAAAGLKRLGMNERIAELIGADVSVPAVGQGAIGIECRSGDAEVQALIAPLDHAPTHARVRAERAFNARLNGGCQVPIGAFAELDERGMRLRGIVGSIDGSSVIEDDVSGPADEGEALGRELAERLLARGADTILREVYAQAGS